MTPEQAKTILDLHNATIDARSRYRGTAETWEPVTDAEAALRNYVYSLTDWPNREA